MSKKETNFKMGVNHSFPIVGIGASAGGLEALESFFSHLPANSGMAFVLILHLSNTQKSQMSQLLRKYTEMSVQEIQDNTPIEPNHVYITVPNKEVALIKKRLHLIKPQANIGMRRPIDYFFHTLAKEQGSRAICIILSGTGSDGTQGLKAIKRAEGMTIVQSIASALYDGMPQSAIATALVDVIAPVEKIPEKLMHYVIKYSVFQKPEKNKHLIVTYMDYLDKIFILIRNHTGHDFSCYKKNTIVRRIERRMVVHQLEQVGDYIKYLQQNTQEIEALFKEFLIGVTSFFRDSDMFEALKEKTFALMLKNKKKSAPVRIWVPGCSTGEEAYSLAILFKEYLLENQINHKIQIFATDIDERALDLARTGLYPDGIESDVTSERLKNHFTKENSAYRISKDIREMVIFATHDLLKDPPFSKLDLISCRNLLIYIDTEIQGQILSFFHYSLIENGVLFLGNSETVGKFDQFFSSIDRKYKLFKRKEVSHPKKRIHNFPVNVYQAVNKNHTKYLSEITTSTLFLKYIEEYLLKFRSHSCVMINEKNDIIYFYGKTGNYLEPPIRNNRLNILEMSRQGLKTPLRTAICKASLSKKTNLVRGIRISENEQLNQINLIVHPIEDSAELKGHLLIIFEAIPNEVLPEYHKQSQAKAISAPDNTNHIKHLEDELVKTKEYLQTIIEELETTNEELQSSNEELQSSNEELQSSNEELKTSQEELQSVNEELVSVNAQLETKIKELTESNNDMANLLSSTEIATVFLDNHLRIKRFTPIMTKIINLISGDIGRPITHIVSNLLSYETLTTDAQAVLDTLTAKEVEVQTQNQDWYLMRIKPYRTTENYISGVVITFVNITEQKNKELSFQQSGDRLINAQRLGKIGSWEWDWVCKKLIWSDEMYRIHGQTRATYKPTVKNYLQFVSHEDKALFSGNLWKLEKTNSVEYCIVDLESQRIKQVILKGETLYNKEGKAIRTVGILQDISVYKQVNSTQRKAKKMTKKKT